MKKKVLVTGGAGFIGSNLIEFLVNNTDYSIWSLDDYSTGSVENHIDGVSYIKGSTIDIKNKIDFVPDIIFHLGEYARVEKSFDDMRKVWESNKKGTFEVLEFCRENNVKIVYAGSSTKFADGGMGRDQSPYAWTKASNTELVRNYGTWFNIPYAITYFYNVYGPRERGGEYGTVIEIFKQKYKKGEALDVVSPGVQVRNFTHVDDIVRGIYLVGEKGSGDDYGLGDERGYRIIDIAKMFTNNINMLPERKGNRMSSVVDVSRAKNEFGWFAEKGVEDYIKKIVSN